VRFILDNNLSPNLARALGLLVPLGDEVTCLKDRGLHDKEDEEWLPLLAAEGDWIVITCDLDIVRNPYRQLVFRKAGLTAFFLLEGWSDGSVRGLEIAGRLLRLWPEITSLAQRHRPGTCFAVPFKGRIRRFSPQGKKPI
jgi:PIN domain-containing protein